MTTINLDKWFNEDTEHLIRHSLRYCQSDKDGRVMLLEYLKNTYDNYSQVLIKLCELFGECDSDSFKECFKYQNIDFEFGEDLFKEDLTDYYTNGRPLYNEDLTRFHVKNYAIRYKTAGVSVPMRKDNDIRSEKMVFYNTPKVAVRRSDYAVWIHNKHDSLKFFTEKEFRESGFIFTHDGLGWERWFH